MIRKFKSFNNGNETTCPICGTGKEEETLLIPILETRKGNICRAVQVHAACFKRLKTIIEILPNINEEIEEISDEI